MDKIIFATGNEHKMIEIRAILSDLGVEILSQKEAGIKGTMDLAKKLEHIVLFEKGKHEKYRQEWLETVAPFICQEVK